MDVSEYEEMKRSQSLLGKALKREKKLSKKLDALNQEKIQLLEDSAYSVSIVEKKEVTEHVYNKVDVETGIRKIADFLHHMHHSRGHRFRSFPGLDSAYEHLVNSLFGKHTSVSELDKTVTRKGFDEYKKQLSEEWKSELSEELKQKLSRLSELEGLYSKAKKENAELKSSNLISTEAGKEKDTIIEELTFELESLKEMKEEFGKLSRLSSELFSQPISILNYNSYKRRLKDKFTNFFKKAEEHVKNR